MNKDIGLKYPRQVGLVDKIKVGGCKMLISNNSKDKSIIRILFS